MTKQASVNARQKWEYFGLTRKTESYLCKDLNTVGQEGWELVTIDYYKDLKGEMSWTAFLKRPVSPDSPPPPAFGQIGMEFKHTPAQAEDQSQEPAGESLGFDLSGESFDIAEE